MFIYVVQYNPEWPIAFRKEADAIKNILRGQVNYIHHIGSTSVPGLMAKPIIDIMLDVVDLDFLDSQSTAFEALGYEVKGELGIPGRRYFRKGGDNRTHQIHAFKTGDENLIRHLAFKEYLIAHPEVAKAYGHLKYQIAQTCNHDIEKYSDEKDPFIKEHEAKALEWYKKYIG